MSLVLNRVEIALDTQGNVVGAFYQQYDTDRQVITTAAPVDVSNTTTPTLDSVLGDALAQALATITTLQAQLQQAQSG